MKIIFFGTPEFAVPSLEILSANFKVIAVVTRADKPAGSGLALKQSPVKEKALSLGIDVYQPNNLSDFKESFLKLNPDICIVSAFGKIIPGWILNHNKGALNIHASLLPKYRGAAPIQRAIMNNEKETGVTIQKMVEKLDAGDILGTKKLAITDADTSGSIHDKLSLLSTNLIIETLKNIDTKLSEKQNENEVTWASKIEKEDTVIGWTKTNLEIFNQIRALNPSPGAKSTLSNIQVKVWQAKLINEDANPGQVVKSYKHSFVIGCGAGSLELVIVQPAGKNKIRGIEFARNNNFKEGDMLIA